MTIFGPARRGCIEDRVYTHRNDMRRMNIASETEMAKLCFSQVVKESQRKLPYVYDEIQQIEREIGKVVRGEDTRKSKYHLVSKEYGLQLLLATSAKKYIKSCPDEINISKDKSAEEALKKFYEDIRTVADSKGKVMNAKTKKTALKLSGIFASMQDYALSNREYLLPNISISGLLK